MRKLYSIAVKCSRVVEKSLIRCNASLFSRHLTSEKVPRESCIEENEFYTSADFILEAKNAIDTESRTDPSAHILYLMDQEIARKVAESIAAHRNAKTPHVIQMNPGPGLLTKELLRAGIQKIEMFERTEYFWPSLTDLQLRFHKNLCLQKVDFGILFEKGHKDWKIGVKNLENYLVTVRERPWRSIASYEVISSVPDRYFIYCLVQSLMFQSELRKKGRMILFFCIPPSVIQELNCKNNHYDIYRSSVILFQTIFRCTVIGEYPRSAFHPQYSKPKVRLKNCRKELSKKDDKSMLLVKIEANRHLFNNKFTEKDLLIYYYFVKHHFKARSTKVIPALESWIPGCGPALIKDGFTIFTQFGELLPRQVLALYIKFKYLPGFKKSSFLSTTNTFFSEMERYGVLNENIVDIDDIFQTSLKEFENENEATEK